MSSGRGWAACAVSLALLTGCGPKKPAVIVSPPAAEAPALPPSQMAASLPAVPPAIPNTTTHTVKLDTTAPPELKPEVAATQPHQLPETPCEVARRGSKKPCRVRSNAGPGNSGRCGSTVG